MVRLRKFQSVRNAAAKLNTELRDSGLDVLCNNAGIMGRLAENERRIDRRWSDAVCIFFSSYLFLFFQLMVS